MTIIRNELQVALDQLHVTAILSADNYRDAAEFIDDDVLTRLFLTLAQERHELATALEEAVRESGAMPSMPDADREAGEQWIHRLSSLFSRDQSEQVIQQRLQAEEKILEVLHENREIVVDDHHVALLANFEAHVETVTSRLETELGRRQG